MVGFAHRSFGALSGGESNRPERANVLCERVEGPEISAVIGSKILSPDANDLCAGLVLHIEINVRVTLLWRHEES